MGRRGGGGRRFQWPTLTRPKERAAAAARAAATGGRGERRAADGCLLSAVTKVGCRGGGGRWYQLPNRTRC